MSFVIKFNSQNTRTAKAMLKKKGKTAEFLGL